MHLKPRLDNDLYQRLLLVLSIWFLLFLLSNFLHLPILLPSLILPIALILATLKSSLQLEVDNRSVLVTGCDTGFGLRLAQHLESLGFTVFAGCLLADRKGEGAEELRQLGKPRLQVIQLDVTKEEDWKETTRLIKEKTGEKGLWGIVNNAGW